LRENSANKRVLLEIGSHVLTGIGFTKKAGLRGKGVHLGKDFFRAEVFKEFPGGQGVGGFFGNTFNPVSSPGDVGVRQLRDRIKLKIKLRVELLDFQGSPGRSNDHGDFFGGKGIGGVGQIVAPGFVLSGKESIELESRGDGISVRFARITAVLENHQA